MFARFLGPKRSLPPALKPQYLWANSFRSSACLVWNPQLRTFQYFFSQVVVYEMPTILNDVSGEVPKQELIMSETGGLFHETPRIRTKECGVRDFTRIMLVY